VNPAAYLEAAKRDVDATLEHLLPTAEPAAAIVTEAMRYAVTSGGKRLRPILALACCESCGGDRSPALEPVAAIELLHTYSLVHDDLPAMDDDDLRRGRPTLHRAFGEAEAILAGDALHTLAFEVAATFPRGAQHAATRLGVIETLARAAGVRGMVGGQIADLAAEGRSVTPDAVRWIHRHKTGALFAASAEIGAILGGADARRREALRRYGAALGLAFQIADDLLDRSGSAETLGKTPGKDEQTGKATFPSRLGVEASRSEADALVRAARAALSPLGLLSEPLERFADHVVRRSF